MSLKFLLKTFSEEDLKLRDTPKAKKPKPAGPDLKGMLQRERLRWKKRQTPYPASTNFSPSSLTYDLCERAKVAQIAGFHTLYHEAAAPKLQLTFDMGHAIHDIVQGYFWEAGVLEGEFRCIKCEKSFWATSPQTCPFVTSHKRRHLQFKEITLINPEYMLRGRSDGIVIMDDERYLMDIKSIANSTGNPHERNFTFEALDENGPRESHIVQLNLYMMMQQQNPDYPEVNIKKGHLLYVGKNSHQTKSFYIEYDPEVVKPYLDQIKRVMAWAEDIKNGSRVDLPDPCSKADCKCENLIAPRTS